MQNELHPPAAASAPSPGPTVLALTRYGSLGASSRVRLLQYLPALRSKGLSVRVHALLDDDYLEAKYRGATPWAHVVRAYASRLRILGPALREADVLWIEKELWPWAPAWIEHLVCQRKPVVLDFDDAIFHNYDLHPNPIVRGLFGRKVDALMRRSTLVIAGNDYLAARAERSGAARVVILPTVIDLERYPIRLAMAGRAAAAPVVIGWIGSPATVHYLEAMAGPLRAIAKEHPIRVHVIGAQLELPGVPTECIPWSEATEVDSIAKLDIGIMPLRDSPWERGKCGYKLIQYMACEVPVVASPVGVNVNIVDVGQNGFLAGDQNEWRSSLLALVTDAELRRQFGLAGRAKVEQRYSLQVTAPRLTEWLGELAIPRNIQGN